MKEKSGKGLTILLIVLVIITGAVLVGKLLGIKLYAVLTPSMSPALETGYVVIVSPTEFEELEEGHIITYYRNKDLETATHRIVAINHERRSFITKGDNNEVSDGKPIFYDNVVGKVVFSIPLLGYILMFFSTLQGKLLAGAILMVFLVLLFYEDKPNKQKEDTPGQDTEQDIQEPPSSGENKE